MLGHLWQDDVPVQAGSEVGGSTEIHPVGVMALAALAALTMLVPRRWCALPIILLLCFIPAGQRVVIATVDFTFVRLLMMVVWSRLFLRRDQFDRFVSAIVYVPREAYDTTLRERITQVLTRAYDGNLTRFQPYFDTGPLARVHFQIALDRGHPEPDPQALEAEITQLARTWDQAFRDALMLADLDAVSREGARTFIGAFNAAYREAFSPEEAMRDVAVMARLSASAPILARAFRGVRRKCSNVHGRSV